MPHNHPSLEMLSALPMTRGPSTWIPPPVSLPPDIHPLPEDINAYFVYPFALEQWVIAPQPPTLSHAEQRSHIREMQQARLDVLRQRQEDRERQRKDALRKVAPGWEGSAASPLEPKRMSTGGAMTPPEPLQHATVASQSVQNNSVLDDLASLTLS